MDWKNIDWVELLGKIKDGEMPENLDKAEVALIKIKNHIKEAGRILAKADGALDDGLKLLRGLKTTMKSVGDLAPFVSSLLDVLNIRQKG